MHVRLGGGAMNEIDNQGKIIYIYGEKHNKCFVTSGISFHDFLSSTRTQIENMLLLKHRFLEVDFHLTSHFEYVEGEAGIRKLARERVSQYGDFCWVDFKDINDLETLEPEEIATLLYLGHMKEPLVGKPLFPRLRNSFAYFATEGEQYTKVYYRYLQDFIYMLCKVIPLQLTKGSKKNFLPFIKGKPLPMIPMSEMEKLLPNMEDGLIFNLEQKKDTRKFIEIPLYKVQSVLGTTDEEDTAMFATLIYGKKENAWSIQGQ